MMKQIGLQPDDGNGNETGRYVSHKIVKGGPFDKTFDKFQKTNDMSLFGDIVTASKKEKGKTSKFKFVCPECGQNAWAKITAKLVCGDCEEPMEEA